MCVKITHIKNQCVSKKQNENPFIATFKVGTVLAYIISVKRII
ncbi:conserved hypothetical protein [Listeria monocytogenes]|nr:conserved hypothetical protein [Listeria monocytogenes]CUL27477.1 conserved hypothetical protein [Listeria monocytogenes]